MRVVRRRTLARDGETRRFERRFERTRGRTIDAAIDAAIGADESRVVAEDDAQVSKSTSQANRIRLDVQLDAPVVVVPRSTSNTTQALELDMGALSAKNAFVDRDDERERDGAANETSRRSHTQAFRRRNDSLAADPDSDSDSEARERSRGTRRRAWDRVVARVSGINVSAVGDSGRRRTPLARTPLAAEATVWRRLDVASENSDDDSPTTIVRAEAASVQLDVSSADFRLLSGCASENLAERPATIPDVVNPAWMDPTRRVASKASVLDEPETPLAAVDERDENAAADDDAKQSSPSPRSSPAFRRPSRLRGWNPSVSPDGPTIATTLFSARVPAVELGLYRGEGRAEPLAMLVVRELAVDAASLEGGASAVAVAVAAFALEDFRDAREPRTVARGGAVDDSGNDTLGRRLPLLAAEIVTGPAVGGARVDVTLQRLRVEAEPTFLLDVGRVFVPTLAGGGGEAPEDVLPADVRVRPGEPFRLDADLELGSTRRVLADAVAGASYILDGGGRSIVVRESELDRGPLVFVGPGATLEIRDARVRVASEDGAETAWASVARLAPGANPRARARDGVVFETLPTAFGDGRGDDRDRVETIVRAEAAPVPLDRLDRGTSPSVLSVSFRATRLELCVVGDVRDASSRDSEGTGNVGSRPIPTSESPDAVHLTLGVAMEATVETDDATRETDVQARLVRVCARDGAGGDVVSPTDVTARYVSREDTLGNPTEDARITVGASPVSLSLSAERVATLARVASRLAAATASAPTRRSRVFRKIWSSDETTRTTWAPSVFDEGAPNARVGAAAWSVWRPNPPAGYASLGDVVASGVAAPPAESSLVVRDSPAFTAPPLRFERETFSSPDAAPGLVAWRPIPPEGFAALGSGVRADGRGAAETRRAMRCVRVELVAAADGVRGRCAAGVGAPPLDPRESRQDVRDVRRRCSGAPRAIGPSRTHGITGRESNRERDGARGVGARGVGARGVGERLAAERGAFARDAFARDVSGDDDGGCVSTRVVGLQLGREFAPERGDRYAPRDGVPWATSPFPRSNPRRPPSSFDATTARATTLDPSRRPWGTNARGAIPGGARRVKKAERRVFGVPYLRPGTSRAATWRARRTPHPPSTPSCVSGSI